MACPFGFTGASPHHDGDEADDEIEPAEEGGGAASVRRGAAGRGARRGRRGRAAAPRRAPAGPVRGRGRARARSSARAAAAAAARARGRRARAPARAPDCVRLCAAARSRRSHASPNTRQPQHTPAPTHASPNTRHPAPPHAQDGGDDTKPRGEDRFDYSKDPISWCALGSAHARSHAHLRAAWRPARGRAHARPCCSPPCSVVPCLALAPCAPHAAPGPSTPRFFQSQIRSEEEFQARKAQLRATARKRLDAVFEKKNKRLVIDSDEEFSIGSSELSAWDSDVASISSLSSCVREWRREAHFGAPAEALLQIALVTLVVRGPGHRARRGGAAHAGMREGWRLRCCGGHTTNPSAQSTAASHPLLHPTSPFHQVAAAYTCWVSFQAMSAVNRFWGIIRHGWAPYGSFVASAALAATAAGCWLAMGRTGKRCLLGFQVALQAAYAVTAALAVLCYLIPAAIDEDVSRAGRGGAGRGGVGREGPRGSGPHGSVGRRPLTCRWAARPPAPEPTPPATSPPCPPPRAAQDLGVRSRQRRRDRRRGGLPPLQVPACD
jgi:hypothetical protein